MDRIEHDREQDREPEGQDGAEQAFEALREEVAALRRGLELVYRQGQTAREAGAPERDYSPTLGAIVQELQGIGARLDAVERAPALATTPGRQAGELREVVRRISDDARLGLTQSQGELTRTVRELQGMMASARSREDQQRWLWTAGVCGAMGGALLWFLATAFLPWGGGTWLAGLAFDGRWNAGQAMLEDASPAQWDRMVRLYNACPKDSTTELCEAAIAVRSAAAPEPGSAKGGTAVSPQRAPRSAKVGQ